MRELNREELKTFLTSRNTLSVVAVFVYTPLCGTCKITEKMINVVQHMIPQLQMFKCNINLMPQEAQKWEIQSVPCLMIIEKGQMLEKIYAIHDVAYLYQKLSPYVSK